MPKKKYSDPLMEIHGLKCRTRDGNLIFKNILYR